MRPIQKTKRVECPRGCNEGIIEEGPMGYRCDECYGYGWVEEEVDEDAEADSDSTLGLASSSRGYTG